MKHKVRLKDLNFESKPHSHTISLHESLDSFPDLFYHSRCIPSTHVRPWLGNRPWISTGLHVQVARIYSSGEDLHEEFSGFGSGNRAGAEDKRGTWSGELDCPLHSVRSDIEVCWF